MKATEFEFRNRWWFIAGIYNFSFFLYAFRDRNSVASVLHWIARRHGNQRLRTRSFTGHSRSARH